MSLFPDFQEFIFCINESGFVMLFTCNPGNLVAGKNLKN